MNSSLLGHARALTFTTFMKVLKAHYQVADIDTMSAAPGFEPWYLRSAYRYYRILKACSASKASRVLDVGAYPFAALKILRLLCGVEISGTGIWGDEVNSALLSDPILRDGYYFQCNLDPWVNSTSNACCTMNLPNGSVDLIILTEVIEHLYNPAHSLREIARVLRPGGTLYLTTNNIAYFRFCFRLLRGETNLDPELWLTSVDFEREHPHTWRGHVRFYSGRQLDAMLRRVGFSSVQTTTFEDCDFHRQGVRGASLRGPLRYSLNFVPLHRYRSHLECIAIKQ
jgi:SAM-dependent methyltransferase